MFDTTERHRAQEALRRSELARQEVLEAMLHSEAAARAQIAGELHDDTIQVMTAALMAVERVTIAAVGTDRRVADALEDARATLRTAVERARRLTFELRPPLLDAQGIGAALRDLADEVGQEGGFAVALAAPDGQVHLSGGGPRVPHGQGGAGERAEALAGKPGGGAAVERRGLAARLRGSTTGAGSTSPALSIAAACGCTWAWTRCASGCGWPGAMSASPRRPARARASISRSRWGRPRPDLSRARWHRRYHRAR